MAGPETALPDLLNLELYSLYALSEDSFLIEDCPAFEKEDFCCPLWLEELAWLEDAAPKAPAPAAAPAAFDQPLGLDPEGSLDDELAPLGGGGGVDLLVDCEGLDQPLEGELADELDDEPEDEDDFDCEELDQPEPELLLDPEERLPPLEKELLLLDAASAMSMLGAPVVTSPIASNKQAKRSPQRFLRLTVFFMDSPLVNLAPEEIQIHAHPGAH